MLCTAFSLMYMTQNMNQKATCIQWSANICFMTCESGSLYFIWYITEETLQNSTFITQWRIFVLNQKTLTSLLPPQNALWLYNIMFHILLCTTCEPQMHTIQNVHLSDHIPLASSICSVIGEWHQRHVVHMTLYNICTPHKPVNHHRHVVGQVHNNSISVRTPLSPYSAL